MDEEYKIIKNKSKIAILLGVYNGEAYLVEQLNSLLCQTFMDWTLYIRDDASTDQTKKIIDKYVNRHENIVQIYDDDGNLGCNGNYFRLLKMVDSDYYMFCNADDYWYQNKIEISFERMMIEENKNKDAPIIVHTNLSVTDRRLVQISSSHWADINLNPEKFKTYNMLGICSFVAGATMLFNNKIKLLTFPIPSCPLPYFDHWIALQTVGKGIIASIYQPTIAYRQIGTNLSALTMGKKNSFAYKLLSIGKVIEINKKDAAILKNIGWGGTLKYIFYKIKVLLILRFGHHTSP